MGGAQERYPARASPVLFVTAQFRFPISAKAEEILNARSQLPVHKLTIS